MMWFLFALISALFFGLRQILAKKALLKEHATEYMTSFAIVVFLLSCIFLPKMTFNYPAEIWGLMYVKVVVFTFSWMFAMKALRHLEISFVVPMLTLSPLVLLVIGAVFLGEIPTIMQYIGVFLLLAGAYWLQADYNKEKLLKPWKTFKNKHTLFILVPIVGYSVCAALDKVILQKADPFTFIFFMFGVLAIHYLVIQTAKYKGLKDVKHAFKTNANLIIMGGAAALISHIAYYMAIQSPGAMVSLIIPVKRMSILVAVVLGGKMFHDHNLKYRIMGCIILIIGAILVVI